MVPQVGFLELLAILSLSLYLPLLQFLLEQETISPSLLDGYQSALLEKFVFSYKLYFFYINKGHAMLQGKRNPGTDLQTVKGFLGLLKEAKVMKVDRLVI